MLGIALAALLAGLIFLSLRIGATTAIPDFAVTVRGAFAALGLGAPLEPALQTIVELRLWRALTAAGVGASLSLSGALVQGVFRNGLASPSVLGISGGASLGAITALCVVGGYGGKVTNVAEMTPSGHVLVPLFAFVGALGTAFLVYRLASTKGHVSIPALLLIGIAINTFFGGLQQLAQMLVINDWEVSKSIMMWSFGTLSDRVGWHAGVAWSGLAMAIAVVPFVAWELDLMQAGLEDAEALGVNTRRVKFLALAAAAIAAGTAVAVAGEIAFVGLVVPHLVRLSSGTSYKTLLALSAVAGACFLLAADVAQHAFVPNMALQPGVVMSLVGGPFFVWLLWSKRRELALW